MPTQDALSAAEKMVADSRIEDSEATKALIDITLELMDLDREKCTVKEAAILRLMNEVNPKSQEKNGQRSPRSGSDAETVWETDPIAREWLAKYHRKVVEKIVVECRARQAQWRMEQSLMLFNRALLDPQVITDAIGGAVFTLQGSLEKHRNQLVHALQKVSDELGGLSGELVQGRGVLARMR